MGRKPLYNLSLAQLMPDPQKAVSLFLYFSVLLNQHAHISSRLVAALWHAYMSAKGFRSNKDGIRGELKASELALDCSIHSLRAGIMCKPQGAHVLAFYLAFL